MANNDEKGRVLSGDATDLAEQEKLLKHEEAAKALGRQRDTDELKVTFQSFFFPLFIWILHINFFFEKRSCLIRLACLDRIYFPGSHIIGLQFPAPGLFLSEVEPQHQNSEKEIITLLHFKH